MDEVTKLRKRITSSFKLSGFFIRAEDSTYLAEQLLPFHDNERENWLKIIAENLQGQRLETTRVERAALEKAINDINRVGLDDGETIFSVINAFTVPHFSFNPMSKKFEEDTSTANRCMLTKCSMQARHMRERYAMLMQKTMRHELFAPSVVEGGISNAAQVKKFKLIYAEGLLSSTSVTEAVIMGLLTQLKEGKFYIEDPTGSVELDLSETRYHSGFFCEGSFVLAEGVYSKNVLKVFGLGFPPAEPASSSRAFFGTQNSWGGESTKLLKYSERLQERERANSEATLVFLSDVRLDLPIVMGRLRQLFVGYDSCPPVAIILMGQFVNSSRNHYELQHLLNALGGLAAGCEQLKRQTDLILIPAGDDPTAPNIFPRPPIPEALAKGLRKAWPRTVLTTNPCRLQYCTQQIVVCRLDLMAKFCRNTLHFPDETENVEQHFARTLVCQGHLTPIHPIAMPVHWDYDAALWLYPLPDLVVIGDSCHSFSTTQHACTVLNTGSFVKSKFAFKVYIPATRTVEDSEIPDDEGEQGMAT